MASHLANIHWGRDGADFTDNRYSRLHQWRFDGGIEVPASSSPHIVPLPMSEARAVDPEEAFVAALASCHMLFFLSIAARRGLVVDAYRDDAVGEMGKNAAGLLAMVRVTLHPSVFFGSDTPPSAVEIAAMHHEAHESCFLARSVTTEIRYEPVP